MTLRNRERPSASNNYGRGRDTRRNKQPEKSPVSTRLITGLVMLAAVIASVIVLLKPFPLYERKESLVITPSTPVTADAVRSALAATGALPDPTAVAVNPDGTNFTVVSADAKRPVASTVWQALERTLPGKLPGATAAYRAVSPDPLNLGLDLRGGLRVLLEAKGTVPTPQDLEQVRNVIENRVNQTGTVEPLVQVQGTNRIVVELPGLSQAEQSRAIALIGKTAKLEFRLLNAAGQAKPDDQPLNPATDLEPAIMTGTDVAKAQTAFDQFGRPVVSFELTAKGAQTFSRITGENVGRRFAIVLDDQIQSAPRIQERLGATAQITGNFTLEQANDLALVLRSGALNIPVEIIETRSIGPTLGADAIRQGIIASLAGIGLIFVLVYAYYGFWFGTVAALGLLFSGLTIFGLLSGLGAVLTLPGIAGLVLTIGAAVDGNVISFERIKEELRHGSSLQKAIKGGFDHSFTTIFDVNFSHLISAIALYNYATGPVKGFAVTLAVGVIASTFSNLFFSRWLLEVFASRFKFSARDWFATPNIHFMEAAKYVTTASIVLAVAGLAIIGFKGFQFGVDFTAGTSIQIQTAPAVTRADVLQAAAGAGVPGVTDSSAQVIFSRTPGQDKNDFNIRVGELTDAQVDQVVAAVTKLQGATLVSKEAVGPSVGRELTRNTILAVLVSLGLTLLYVWYRFDLVLGVGSVLAVAHDVFICFGLYALLGREFTITTVAAVLTLIGYSLNDSIIVSDRIRENLKVMRGEPYAKIVNTSINQTLSRTLLTSVSTMLPLLALLIAGGPTLRDFSLILVIGILVGTYSSIYIVAPLAVWWKDYQDSRKKPGRMVKT
jgi:SecD/SecF fusion protein